jgi:hypothetical protein
VKERVKLREGGVFEAYSIHGIFLNGLSKDNFTFTENFYELPTYTLFTSLFTSGQYLDFIQHFQMGRLTYAVM